ncbi:MAG: nucleoid-associated protein [Saprospiraceae bacterium]|nr:nucleoid-associated protein [Saprospiraceae bacterium]
MKCRTHTSRSGSKHWSTDFLQLSPKGNDYSYTSDFIKLTSSFLKNRKPIEQILDKKDGVEALGRSFDYFKSNENFDEKQYKKEVFREDAVIEAFDDYKHRWQEKTQRPLADAFEACPEALQKQSRVFRSVIKLDRNFHVYVHGDHDMIQKGVDEHGRKYYILYYHEES